MKKKYESPKIAVVGGVSEITQGMLMGSFPDRMGGFMMMAPMGIS